MSDIQRASKAPSKPSFSAVRNEPKKATWAGLSRELDAEDETKNYRVPPELIELARANHEARGQAGILTPLAPKPPQEVAVVVPPVAPLVAELRTPIAPDRAPSAQRSTRAVTSPLSAMFRAELAAAGTAEHSPAETTRTGPTASVSDAPGARPSSRRSSRRGRRASGISMPAEASEAARAATIAEPARTKGLLPYLAGGAIVGVYIVLCYYVNALIAGLP